MIVKITFYTTAGEIDADAVIEGATYNFGDVGARFDMGLQAGGLAVQFPT